MWESQNKKDQPLKYQCRCCRWGNKSLNAVCKVTFCIQNISLVQLLLPKFTPQTQCKSEIFNQSLIVGISFSLPTSPFIFVYETIFHSYFSFLQFILFSFLFVGETMIQKHKIQAFTLFCSVEVSPFLQLFQDLICPLLKYVFCRLFKLLI